VTEEHQVVHSHHRCRRGLLLAAHRCHLGARDRTIAAAGITIGDQAVRDVHTQRGERGHGAGRAEVDVVGVRHHHQQSIDLGGLQHATSLGNGPGAVLHYAA
jgi:hypothetical protein